MLAPVIIFVYNRPKHTEMTIEALAKNHLAKETDVYIFSDAEKNPKSKEAVIQVRDYLNSLTNKNYFKSITMHNAGNNKGLARSVIEGVTKVFEEQKKVIVLEDDLVTSIDFLEYMNEALDYYEKNKKIWSISGYTYNLKIPKDYKEDVYLSYRGSSWGWATWKDRWDKVDWDVLDYNEFKNNSQLRKKLNRGGRDMASMLHSQMQGLRDSWAIRWCYTQSKEDMYTVYPVKSKIRNIGLDGSGTHGGVTSKFDTSLSSNGSPCKFSDITIDKRIVRNFRNYYMSNTEYFIHIIKSKIKKIMRGLR